MTALFDVPAATRGPQTPEVAGRRGSATSGTPRKKSRRRARPTVDPTGGVRYTTSTDDRGRRTWALTYPAPAEMPSVNSGHQHWRRVSPIRKTWREATYLHARAAKLPTGLARVRIDVTMQFPTAGRRDVGNYYTHVVKPIVDALGPTTRTERRGKPVVGLGHGLIADDTAEYLDGPHLALGPKVADRVRCPFGAVTVVITDLSAVDGAGVAGC